MQQQAKTVNLEVLRKAMNDNPKVRQGLEVLSERKRGRYEMTFRRMKRILDSKQGIQPWTKEDLRMFFQTLQAAGVGHVVFSRDTPRLLFDFHLQSVGAAALGKAGAVLKQATPKRTHRKPLPVVARPTVKLEAAPSVVLPKRHFARLKRPGFEVEVELTIQEMAELMRLSDIKP